MMLFISATGMTSDDVAELRRNHDIDVRPGYVTRVSARKIDGQIVWSIERTKEVCRRTLEETEKNAETSYATVV